MIMRGVKQTCLLLLLLIAGLQSALAVCSSYHGLATINEVHRQGNASRFVEIKLLDTSIPQSVWSTWTLRLCNDSGTCSGNISLSNAIDNTPWLVIDRPYITNQNYIDLDGMSAILRDSSGNTIDYLSIGGYLGQQDGSCTPAYDWTMAASNTQTIERNPDGTGEWRSTGGGASGGDTDGGTNDEAPGGGAAPAIEASSVTVLKGQTASFTLSLPGGAVGYDISVSYQTLNGTAVAGTDYTTTSGTATINSGTTSTSVNVPTIAGSTSGEVYFYLYLSNPVNGTVTNHYPTGTILANAVAAWYMDESAWDGTAGEVIDATGNGYDGTATNGTTTSDSTPAIAGTPGTCGYGVFDGSNDYIALPGFPNLTSSFTIAAWINAHDIGNDQRIFADDQNNSGGYAFSLGDGGNGRLRFFSRNISPVSLDTAAVITTGTWYHVAAVHNASTRTRQIYVNGVLRTSGTYTGTWGSDNGAASIGGENNNAGAEATANWRFDGLIDEVHIYTSALNASALTALMNQTRPCLGLHHLRIEHDGNALTCEPENITIKACANSSCSSLYGSDVSVTLTPSGWVGGDTQVISGGQGTFQLRNTTAGAVTLGVSSSAPLAGNAVECLNTATSANSCALTFHDTGFIYTIPTQTSCATSGNITISAVRLDDTTQACVPTFNNQTRNVNFRLNYSNPATGSENLTLNYNSTAYTVTTGGIGVPVSFDANGQAVISVQYPDAGQITLNSQYTGSLASNDAGLSMLGNATFVTRPYKLYVYADEANAACAGSIPTCTAFKRAGDAFDLKVRAACVDNSTTPNFQLNGLTLTHTNTAPAIVQGTISVNNFNITDADNGGHTISQTVSEVGAYTFTAALPVGGYFGETIGDATLNTSSAIGRFYPDHFCISTSPIINRSDTDSASGCTDNSSYLDEDFTVQLTLTAQAMGSICSSADLTQNYDGTWSKFDTPYSEDTTSPAESGKWNFAAVNDPGGTPQDLSSRIELNTAASTPANGQFSNGTVTLNAQLNIDRSGSAPNYSAETPMNDVRIGIYPLDSDGVGVDTTDLVIAGNNYREVGNTALYFGRLFAENAYGTNDSATPLDMFARTEYCTAVSGGTCTSWQHNTSDSCTLYNIAPPAGTALGGYYARASAAVPSAAFNFNDTGTAPDYARVHVPDTLNHSAGWRLFYNGGGDGGDFVIPFRFPFNTDPSVHPYLLHLDGIASFGQFRGDDRIIFWREVLE